VSQGPAAQGVAGQDESRLRRKARGRAAQEGTGEGGARRITGGSPAGGRMEARSVSPAGVRVGGSWMGARSIAMRAGNGEVGWGKTGGQ